MGLNWWKNKVMERMAEMEMERLGMIIVCGEWHRIRKNVAGH